MSCGEGSGSDSSQDYPIHTTLMNAHLIASCDDVDGLMPSMSMSSLPKTVPSLTPSVQQFIQQALNQENQLNGTYMQSTQSLSLTHPVLECNPYMNSYLEIVEQPQSRGFRFRYACEGSSHGGVRGEHNSRSQRTFPSVQVMNYRGPAKVAVTLVTDETHPKPHAHELIGKDCKNGTCTVQLNGEDMNIVFQNLGIRHVTKKNVKSILEDRILETMRINKLYTNNNINANIKNTESEQAIAHQQAEEQARTMQLNVVRLCFTAYLPDSFGEFKHRLTPVVSQPIYDSKSPGTAALRIYRMDKCNGCCNGQEEIFVLCDKVQKDDISVRFF